MQDADGPFSPHGVGGEHVMGIFGKVLIVLNILAGVGFVYLVAADRAERQKWTAAAFRHELLIVGLPLEPSKGSADDDFVPFDFKVNDAQRLTQVRKDT